MVPGGSGHSPDRLIYIHVDDSIQNKHCSILTKTRIIGYGIINSLQFAAVLFLNSRHVFMYQFIWLLFHV